ncbi:hypothetical protein [Paenibacillus fonticola]|uniref:hypothetical protein n=1 Tax=Paenibacillus fonticola TaxID=379896 RepID=UPI00038286FE|nr:hypothetical protein [Paenibacillus fonticola]
MPITQMGASSVSFTDKRRGNRAANNSGQDAIKQVEVIAGGQHTQEAVLRIHL